MAPFVLCHRVIVSDASPRDIVAAAIATSR
jgi:hypothetical protein